MPQGRPLPKGKQQHQPQRPSKAPPAYRTRYQARLEADIQKDKERLLHLVATFPTQTKQATMSTSSMEKDTTDPSEQDTQTNEAAMSTSNNEKDTTDTAKQDKSPAESSKKDKSPAGSPEKDKSPGDTLAQNKTDRLLNREQRSKTVTSIPAWICHFLNDRKYIESLLQFAPPEVTYDDLVQIIKTDPGYFTILRQRRNEAKYNNDTGESEHSVDIDASPYNDRYGSQKHHVHFQEEPQRGNYASPPPQQHENGSDQKGYVRHNHKWQNGTGRTRGRPSARYNEQDDYTDHLDNFHGRRYMLPRPPPPVMPKFHGYESESFEMFEEDLEEYFTTLGYGDDYNHPMKPSIMVQALQGLPRIKFKSLSHEQQKDHSFVMDLLRQAHGKHTKDRMSVLRSLSAVTSQDYESIEKGEGPDVTQCRHTW